jgi:hypothetical protein
MWNEVTWPKEYPLSMHEMSFLLPHFLKDGRGKLDTYFTRVYNPVWTNPDGFSWIEALTNEDRIGCHVALTPTWNETSYFADYVLPMGLGSERHDIHSYETHDSQWLGFRQPVLRAARERNGQTVADTREVNPGEVWEENEFWLDLTWRIDPDGSLGVRQRIEAVLAICSRVSRVESEMLASVMRNSATEGALQRSQSKDSRKAPLSAASVAASNSPCSITCVALANVSSSFEIRFTTASLPPP